MDKSVGYRVGGVKCFGWPELVGDERRENTISFEGVKKTSDKSMEEEHLALVVGHGVEKWRLVMVSEGNGGEGSELRGDGLERQSFRKTGSRVGTVIMGGRNGDPGGSGEVLSGWTLCLTGGWAACSWMPPSPTGHIRVRRGGRRCPRGPFPERKRSKVVTEKFEHRAPAYVRPIVVAEQILIVIPFESVDGGGSKELPCHREENLDCIQKEGA